LGDSVAIAAAIADATTDVDVEEIALFLTSARSPASYSAIELMPNGLMRGCGGGGGGGGAVRLERYLLVVVLDPLSLLILVAVAPLFVPAILRIERTLAVVVALSLRTERTLRFLFRVLSLVGVCKPGSENPTRGDCSASSGATAYFIRTFWSSSSSPTRPATAAAAPPTASPTAVAAGPS
jgi:hypothetical protein